jgi:hypothetical protein
VTYAASDKREVFGGTPLAHIAQLQRKTTESTEKANHQSVGVDALNAALNRQLGHQCGGRWRGCTARSVSRVATRACATHGAMGGCTAFYWIRSKCVDPDVHLAKRVLVPLPAQLAVYVPAVRSGRTEGYKNQSRIVVCLCCELWPTNFHGWCDVPAKS